MIREEQTPRWVGRLLRARVLWRLWLALLLLSPLVWMVVAPYASTRTLVFGITPRGEAGPWAVEWERDGGGANGAWLDVGAQAPGTELHRQLPSYAITSLRLRADPERPSVADVSVVRMQARVWGIARPEVELSPATANTAEVRIERATRLRSSDHVLGIAGVVFVLLALGGAGLLVLRLTRLATAGALLLPLRVAAEALARSTGPFVRRSGAFWVVLALTAAVHAWMAAWGPMLYLPDGVEYIYNAHRLHQTGDFSHFSAWRMPGTSFFLLPFITVFARPEAALGWFQALGGVLIAAMVYDILRRCVPKGWALLGMLLVGIEPFGLIWERHIITEAPTALLFALAAWIIVRAGSWELATRRGLARAVAGALVLGLIAALATYVRGNALILVLLAPVFVAASLWRSQPRRRVVLVAAVVGVAALAAMVPWIVRTNRVFGVPAMIVGKNFARVIFAWYADEIDVNQTAAFGFEAWKEAARRQEAGANEFDFMPQLDASPRLPAAAGVHPWLRRDQRYKLVADESRARRKLPGAVLAAKCLLSHLFIYQVPAHPYFRSTEFYTQPHRGKLIPGTTTNWFRAPEEMAGMDPALLGAIAARTRWDIAWVTNSPHAATFRRFYFGFEAVRPVLGVLFLAGGLAAARRWNIGLMAVAAIWMGNTVAFSWLILNGETRYSEPLYPLLIVVAVYGAAALCGVVRVRGRAPCATHPERISAATNLPSAPAP